MCNRHQFVGSEAALSSSAARSIIFDTIASRFITQLGIGLINSDRKPQGAIPSQEKRYTIQPGGDYVCI